jgi:hypothetical protein
MTNKYPAAYLLVFSLFILLGLTLITPLVEKWHIFFAIMLPALTFVLKVVSLFFLFGIVIELINRVHVKNRHP